MRKILIITLIALFGIKTNATIVYLNNSTTTNNSQRIYRTFAEAYNKCSNGDTIYVIGSNNHYGAIGISKPITIIGPGYFLDKNHETQVNKKEAVFDDISFLEGSEGSTIKGISNSRGTGSELNIYTSNITVENCFIIWFIAIKRGDDANISNITIKKCYFKSSSYASIRNNNGYDGIWSNINISNNIIHNGIEAPDGSTGIINGNLIDDNFDIGESSTFEIHNNILLATSSKNISMPLLPNASITHNLSVIDYFGTDNGNIAGVSASNLFLGSTGTSTDGQYQLGKSSDALGAGKNGIDAGPFGGNDPYRLSGLPNLPNIYELSTGGFVSGDEMKVRLKIKQ